MKYKLVCFDVDGTLVDNIEYSWQLFHDFFKIDKTKRKLAKEAFYSGKISYIEWANHDINLWKEYGAKKEDFFQAMKESKIKVMKGALDTIKEIKKNGLRIAIISGSINIIMEHLFPDYKEVFDDIFLSYLFFDNNGNITRVDATEYDMEGKALALKKIAEKENISLSECVFIGDHHNDIEIAKEAGLSIAFDAKDNELKEIADVIIDDKDLTKILKYIL